MPYFVYFILGILSLSLTFTTPVNATPGFIKYPGNPIFGPGLPGGWDYRYVNDPFVLKQDGQYKMWYSGHGELGRWTIGYAYSPNGIGNWSRLTYPVVDIGSPDGWEHEITDPTVLFFTDPPYYRMWYVSTRSGPPAGGDKSRLRYATSTDGISWNELDWVMRATPGSWDSGGIGRGRSIILRNGVYRLWYAATNNDDITVNPKFQIGYATSPDGINWTKQNGGNPVISPTEPWELNNVSFPTVLYDDGKYKMWYATGAGDQPTQIAYAYSTDGIVWIKPADENPAITRTAGAFDSTALTVSGILRESDNLRLYYSGYGGTNWSIGIATESAMSITPTPTPTPSSTPTPTPTPYPTIGSFELPVSYPERLGASPSGFKKAFWSRLTAAFDHVRALKIFRPFTGATYKPRDCRSGTYGITCYDSHNGTDFSKFGGLNVFSVANGTVTFTSNHDETSCTPNKGGFGCVVIIEYPIGVFGLYAHLSKIFVNSGGNVNATTILGEMGKTGCPTCGVHLHFGALKPLDSASRTLTRTMTSQNWQDLLYQIKPDTTLLYKSYCTYRSPNGAVFSFQDPSGWAGADADPWSLPKLQGGCGITSPYLWKYAIGTTP